MIVNQIVRGIIFSLIVFASIFLFGYLLDIYFGQLIGTTTYAILFLIPLKLALFALYVFSVLIPISRKKDPSFIGGYVLTIVVVVLGIGIYIIFWNTIGTSY